MQLRWILGFLICVLYCQSGHTAQNELYLGSREGDPLSLVENVSTIHGDYSEIEMDLVVPAPDSLILSRFYSSRDTLPIATFGGWRYHSHCYLVVQKDPRGKMYTSAEGRFERTFVYLGNPDGTILTYVGWKNHSSLKKSLFKIDVECGALGIANTAKGSISSWTNLKNNQLHFNPQNDSFTLELCTGIKRFYTKHSSLESYLLNYETMPSGNKIFYEYDPQGQLILMNETDSTEKKNLGWIKFQYEKGIHVETSDGKSVEYHFQQYDEVSLLTEVLRSDKPSLHYQYQVVDGHALLKRKELPEGRFISLEYHADHKVKSIATPISKNEIAKTHFIYKKNHTEVCSPNKRNTLYRFDDRLQLVAIEQYLDGSLYRIDKKYWGKKQGTGNLIATSVEDGVGDTYYYKSFIYDDKENVVAEHEYGNLTGGDKKPIVLDEEGIVLSTHTPHSKSILYSYGKEGDVVIQRDSKGNGVEFAYRKGTNLLVRKSCLKKEHREKQWYYHYNSEGVLIRTQVGDGDEEDPESIQLITIITPKKELPNAGAPEMIEEKYLNLKWFRTLVKKNY